MAVTLYHTVPSVLNDSEVNNFFYNISLLMKTQETFVDMVDQDQTTPKLQSDL